MGSYGPKKIEFFLTDPCRGGREWHVGTPGLLTSRTGTKIKGLERTVFEIIAVLCRETVVQGGGFSMRRVGGAKLHVVGILPSSFGSSGGKV